MTVEANLEELRTPAALRAWFVSHLREDHGFEAEESPPDEAPFAPVSLGDLKAAHDQVHALLAELEVARVRDAEEERA